MMAEEKIAGEHPETQPAGAGERAGIETRTDDRPEGRRRSRRRGAKSASQAEAEPAQAAQAARPANPGPGPAEKNAEKPAEKSTEKSADKPAEKPVDKSAGNFSARAAGKPVEKPSGNSGKQPERSVGNSSRKPAEAPAAKSRTAAKSVRTAPDRRPGRGSGGAGTPAAKRASVPSSAAAGRSWKWRDDLRRLAIVVIGAALAIGASKWIDRIGQRREERQVMRMVYEELQGNRAQIALLDEALRSDGHGMRHSLPHSAEDDALPADSLAEDPDAPRSVTRPAIRTDALETLRSSAAAVSRCDKGLLRAIYFCYGSIPGPEERTTGRVRRDDVAALDAQMERTLAAIDEQYGFER